MFYSSCSRLVVNKLEQILAAVDMHKNHSRENISLLKLKHINS